MSTTSSNGHSQAVYEDTQTFMPPHNDDAEAALIGSILIDPDRLVELDLEPNMFFSHFYRSTYDAFLKLKEKKQPIDFITVLDILRGKGIEEEAKLAGLIGIVPTSSNLLGYANIVKTMYVRRQLIAQAGKTATGAYDEETDLDEIIAATMDGIRTIGGDNSDSLPQSSHDVCLDVLAKMTNRRDSKAARNSAVLTTGFTDLDRLLEGLEAGSLVTFAGRPGQGKSAVETVMRLNVAKSGKRVATFNLEMDADQLTFRAISSMVGLPYKSVYMPNALSDMDWLNVNKALGKISEYPMFIDTPGSLSISELESKTHRLFADHGHFDLITVDYLQLMRGRKGAKNRVEEVGQITRGLKQLARELKTTIWANAQVNRAVENRIIKMPVLADLRESGDIEQDSDVVIFIMREETYNPETPRQNIASLSVAKNRNAPTGEIDLYFNANKMRIGNLTRTEIIDL